MCVRDTVRPSACWVDIDDVVLVRGGVEIRAAVAADAPDLFTALDLDECWRHVIGRPTSVDGMAQNIEASRGVGRHMFTVRRDGSIVGTTSFLDVSVNDARLEIGSTMYMRSEWATDLNPTCKFLLMSHAFETLGMGRVQLKTDIRNTRSQRAIERLGAKREGVLRRYQRRTDGSVRDTVMYSVMADEWPDVRTGLLERVGV